MDQPQIGKLGAIPSDWRNNNLLIVPLLLVFVACIQLYRAFSMQQSPWKGGGFGMFSTVDSPGARFLRIRIHTATGEFPVTLPKILQPQGLMARTVPSEANAKQLAVALLKMTWVPQDFAKGIFHESETDSTASAEVTPLDIRAPAIRSSAADPKPLYRVKQIDEPEPKTAEQIQVQGVSVDVCRQQWNKTSRQLSVSQIASANASK
jgi:hypothetical protein